MNKYQKLEQSRNFANKAMAATMYVPKVLMTDDGVLVEGTMSLDENYFLVMEIATPNGVAEVPFKIFEEWCKTKFITVIGEL